jgi:serine/threonine protein kinase
MRACYTCQGRFEDRRLICPTDGDMLIDEGRPAPETGWTLGAWRIGNLLGEGGMGRVFEAAHLVSGEVAAVKVLKEGPSGVEQARKRFQMEAEAAAAIEHPGVAKVREFARTPDGTSYIVMERLHGSTFDELRRAGKFAEAERVVELLLEICDVLALAHQRGIVHRDLKPSNIFLHREGRDRSRVKVLDFGIAKFLDRAGDRLTSTGDFLGSLLYMAPEQTASEAVTTAVDVYSLGVILFEALTGALPFTGRSPAELLRLHASMPAPALSNFRPEVSPELEMLVERCLMKKPQHRYGDARELGDALRGISVTRKGGDPARAARTTQVNAAHWVGAVLDERYEIQEWIAPSRFGSDVYRASHLRAGADVAVRLWRTGRGSMRDRLIDVFRREARAMAVRHPNLIAIIDLGYDDRCVYVVTELVDSISLRTLLARKGALPEAVSAELVRGAAGALRALHEKGIISGGLSPETMRVAMGGAGPEKLLLTPLGLSDLEEVGLLSGAARSDDRSLDYISPEQRAGARPDARSDLYSLAVILLEMLCGPPEVSTAPEAGPPAAEPATGARQVPPGQAEDLGRWTGFFRRALAPDPDARYASAAEFLAAIPA